MGDVGLPLRGDCHVCRMGGRYHDGGDDDGDDGDGCGDVDGGGGGNCKVTYIHSCNACDKFDSHIYRTGTTLTRSTLSSLLF